MARNLEPCFVSEAAPYSVSSGEASAGPAFGPALAGTESSAPSGVIPNEAKGLIFARSFDSHDVARDERRV